MGIEIPESAKIALFQASQRGYTEFISHQYCFNPVSNKAVLSWQRMERKAILQLRSGNLAGT